MARSDAIKSIAVEEIEVWRLYGKCLDMTDLFYSDKGNGSFVDNQRAKSICNGTDGRGVCPVREHCLEYALQRKERFGVWGGMTERERKRLSKTRLAG